MAYIMTLLRNKYFWIVLGAIILIVILYRNWNIIKARLFAQRNPEYAKDSSGNIIPVTELDKARLNILVDKIRDEITSNPIWGGVSPDTLEQINNLSDQELEYFVKRYKTVYGESFYKDLDNESLPFTEYDDKILNRIQKIGFGY